MLNELKEFTIEFFEKLGVDLDSIDVSLEEDGSFYIKIDTPDSGLLIGNHGANFEAIQSLFRNIFSNKYDKKVKLHLEINDYIHNKDARLFRLLDKDIAKAKETGRNMKLPKLNAYERKKAHSYVADLGDEEIKTESRGEGEERRLYIILTKNIAQKNIEKPKTRLEIDIDSVDI